MKKRTCRECSAGFEVPISSTRAFCSDRCKYRNRDRKRTQSNSWARPSDAVICYICGEPTWVRQSQTSGRSKHGKCWEHGTRAGYEKHGCRCAACREWMELKTDQAIGPRQTYECTHCGKPFTTRRRPALFCSKECGQRHSGGSRWISPEDRLSIYERDNWTCQLCGDPVDPDAIWHSNWYPSLDHIVPRSLAEVPDHSPSNLRTAHRWCNIARGTADTVGLFGEIEDVHQLAKKSQKSKA